MTSHASVGLIINPMAGRDIRRLVAAASLQSGPEKALVARRIVAGLQAVPGTEVIFPQDHAGFFSYVVEEMGDKIPYRLLDALPDDTTEAWVGAMEAEGAHALIVVGGDGTQRNVAQAEPKIPVLPLAGGTNNVACWLGDQTAGAYAVARYLADRRDPEEVAWREKIIHLTTGRGRQDLALIDAVLVQQNFTGAMAVWHADDVDTMVLAVADPTRPGLSNLGGYMRPVAPQDDRALFIEMGEGPEARAVSAVLAPGLVEEFAVGHITEMGLGETIVMARDEGGSLALDGERTLVLRAGETVEIIVRRDGPYILDPRKILEPRS